MIKNFACRRTEAFFRDRRSRYFPPEIQKRALMRLNQLAAAASYEDLRIPPSNHLEKLKGDRTGMSSIRINDQWRVCFSWRDQQAFDVEIIDYH